MSVRMSLLTILDQGPSYGYRLRTEFERRTGSTWPLNVGQIYNTLERLERDGLVARGSTDEHGHVFYDITDAGSAEVRAWLRSPMERSQGARDELAMKIAIAATMPGVEASDVLQSQRTASLHHLQELRRATYAGADRDGAEELAWSLVVDAMIFQVEAEVRWLDHTEQLLAERAVHDIEVDREVTKPKRGRPAKVPVG
ncbi:MAG: PadR family transcriptional regulator [Actinobacteria bacterium]|nr:PadR family transcriptional regulator [Actinomycetota bacterium]